MYDRFNNIIYQIYGRLLLISNECPQAGAEQQRGFESTEL